MQPGAVQKGYMYIAKHELFPLGFFPVQMSLLYVNMELQVKGINGIFLLVYYNNIPCVSLIFPIWSFMRSYVLDIVKFIMNVGEDMKKYLNKVKHGFVMPCATWSHKL